MSDNPTTAPDASATKASIDTPAVQGADKPSTEAAPAPEKKTYTPDDFAAMQKKISDLEKETFKYREQKRKSDAEAVEKAEKEAKERGEFQQLYEKEKGINMPLLNENTQLKEAIKGLLESNLNSLSPVEKNQFLEFFGELDPQTQLKKLSAWSKTLPKSPANGQFPAGTLASQVGNPQQQTQQFIAAMAQAKEAGDLEQIKYLRNNDKAILAGKASINRPK
jgi:hypothetical protein